MIIVKKKIRPFYYRYFKYFHFVKAFEWNVIRKWLKPNNRDVILDIACGHGHFVRRLWKPGLKIFGVDLNKNGIGIAQRYNSPEGCGFVLANAMDLPFADSMFDKIMSVCALEHFFDDEKAIKEINRILKKEGKIVLSVDSFSYQGISSSYKEKCKGKHFVHRFYTNQLLKNKLKRFGFKIINEKYLISSPISSMGYKLGTFFRWWGIDFMDPFVFIFLYPISCLIENILGLRFKKQGYILVVEAIKAFDQI